MVGVAVAVGAILAYLNPAGKIVLPVTTPIVLVSGVLALVSDSGDECSSCPSSYGGSALEYSWLRGAT